MKTKYNPNKHDLIPYPVIVAASQGDPLAIQTVLRHYRGYIATLATTPHFDYYGNPYLAIDPEIQEQLENELITGILKFRPAA